jgi:hypothetical protein
MVTNKLSSGRLLGGADAPSDFEAFDARAFTEGDFVDVCVGFDIVSRRGPRRGETQYNVRMTLQHVLLLKSASDIEADRTEVS